jgi:hypothetical protein
VKLQVLSIKPCTNPSYPEEELTVTHNTLDIKIDNGLKMAVTSQLADYRLNTDEYEMG